jgi:hypothetical protein
MFYYLGLNRSVSLRNTLALTAKQLKHSILSISDVYMYKDIKKGDYDIFLNYLKKEQFFIRRICEKEHGKLLLNKLLKVFGLRKIDKEKLFEYIKENAACELVKVSDWKSEKDYIISKDSEKEILIYSAEFECRNKWGYKFGKKTYQIIYYDNKIIWMSRAGKKPQYLILQNEKIYGLSYSHKKLTLIKNLESSYKEIWLEKIDDIIPKYIDTSFFAMDLEESFCFPRPKIDLTACFNHDFFKNEIQINRNMKIETLKIKSVTFKKELLKIEIENLIYSYSGFIFLDLESGNVTKGNNMI